MSIALRDITVAYEDKLVLDRFSLTLPESGVCVLFGPSGSGKTTLLDVICGLLAPSMGAVEGLNGKTIARVFQDNRLIPWASAAENIACAISRQTLARIAADRQLVDGLFGGIAPTTVDPVVATALEVTGLAGETDTFPDELSGGMQKRLGLARALAFAGDVVILDEPTAGLDVQAEWALFDRLMKLWASQLVILVTHERPLAERYGTSILELTGPPLAIVEPS